MPSQVENKAHARNTATFFSSAAVQSEELVYDDSLQKFSLKVWRWLMDKIETKWHIVQGAPVRNFRML